MISESTYGLIEVEKDDNGKVKRQYDEIDIDKIEHHAALSDTGLKVQKCQ